MRTIKGSVVGSQLRELVRRVVLRPFRKGEGPVFTLALYETDGLWDRDGCPKLGYRLHASQGGRSWLIFEGADFRPSRYSAIDSDEVLLALLGFLTLRRGDVEAEYFADYSEGQLTFRDEHAEALSWEAHVRFGSCAE